MTDKFTASHLNQIEKCFDDHPDTYVRTGKENIDRIRDWVIAELTKPGFQYPDHQIVFANVLEDDQPTGIYGPRSEFTPSAKVRPLTPPEVGNEPVQHFIDCIERLASDAEFDVSNILKKDDRHSEWYPAQMLARKRFAQECITKHQELMK